MNENIKLIIQLLGTTVIATIITSLFSFYKSKKDDKLNHIVEERKIWRESLREIVKSLNEVEYSKPSSHLSDGDKLAKIKQSVSELECRINPKGLMNENKKELDAHIWKLINKIYNYTDYIDLKSSGNIDTLRRYISSLLKFDWERSKTEIVGSNFSFLLKFIDFISILLFIFIIYSTKIIYLTFENFHSNEVVRIIYYYLLFICLLFILFFPYEKIGKNRKFLLLFYGQLVFSIVFIFTALIGYKKPELDVLIVLLIFVLLQLTSFVFKAIIYFSNLNSNHLEYIKLINTIDSLRE